MPYISTAGHLMSGARHAPRVCDRQNEAARVARANEQYGALKALERGGWIPHDRWTKVGGEERPAQRCAERDS